MTSLRHKSRRTFGAFVKTHREAKGLSQAKLSSVLTSLRTPLSRQCISLIERDLIDPHFSTVLALLKALEVPFSRLSAFFDYRSKTPRKGGSHARTQGKGPARKG